MIVNKSRTQADAAFRMMNSKRANLSNFISLFSPNWRQYALSIYKRQIISSIGHPKNVTALIPNFVTIVTLNKFPIYDI